MISRQNQAAIDRIISSQEEALGRSFFIPNDSLFDEGMRFAIALVHLKYRNAQVWQDAVLTSGASLFDIRFHKNRHTYFDIAYLAKMTDGIEDIVSATESLTVNGDEEYRELLVAILELNSGIGVEGDKRPDRYRYQKKPRKCPVCGFHGIATYDYGMPAFDLEENDNIMLGGCCVTDDQPRWRCNLCETDLHYDKPLQIGDPCPTCGYEVVSITRQSLQEILEHNLVIHSVPSAVIRGNSPTLLICPSCDICALVLDDNGTLPFTMKDGRTTNARELHIKGF